LLAIYVTVIEDRRIMSAKYCLFFPKLTHPAGCSAVSALAELLVVVDMWV